MDIFLESRHPILLERQVHAVKFLRYFPILYLWEIHVEKYYTVFTQVHSYHFWVFLRWEKVSVIGVAKNLLVSGRDILSHHKKHSGVQLLSQLLVYSAYHSIFHAYLWKYIALLYPESDFYKIDFRRLNFPSPLNYTYTWESAASTLFAYLCPWTARKSLTSSLWGFRCAIFPARYSSQTLRTASFPSAAKMAFLTSRGKSTIAESRLSESSPNTAVSFS